MAKIKAKRMKLYEYQDPNTLIDSQYGSITYLNWLRKEKTRIEYDSSRRAEVVEYKGNFCLMVNASTGCSCDFCLDDEK